LVVLTNWAKALLEQNKAGSINPKIHFIGGENKTGPHALHDYACAFCEKQSQGLYKLCESIVFSPTQDAVSLSAFRYPV
jgi:hypothetical protein